MTKPLAVYTDYDDFDPSPGVTALRDAGFDVMVLNTQDHHKVLEHAVNATAILCSALIIDSTLMAQMPRLKIISQLGQGVDNIDVNYATEQGIWVCNINDIASTEVAEHAWSLIYALTRELKFFLTANRNSWFDRPSYLPKRLSEMTLGLVGIGHIGYKIGVRAHNHVARTLCFDYTQRPNAVPDGVERVFDLIEMFSQCHIISVQMPLRGHTHHIINNKTLAALSPGSYLVNIGRSGLVDTAAVRHAIDSGQLAGYATDVFEKEPPDDNDPLWGHPRILTTPHIAYLSETSRNGYLLRQYQNIVQWAHTGKPIYPVNNIDTLNTLSHFL